MNTKPGVLILCQLFYPELISTGQTLTELGESLEEMGIQVEALCGPMTYAQNAASVPRSLTYRGIEIRRVLATRFYKGFFLGRVLNEVTYGVSVFCHLLFSRSKKPILVLTNPAFLAFFCALLKKIGLGRPYIFLVFDVYPDTAINLGVVKSGGFIARIWERVNLFAFQHASRIIVIGRCMKDIIVGKLNAHGRSDLTNKIEIIHVWSDDKNIAESSNNPPSSLEQDWKLGGKFVLLYAGNMGRFHDLETIMGAAKSLRDKTEIEFVFVGEGHKKKWAQEYAKENKLPNCQFHTYVERDQLGNLLNLADVGLVSLCPGQEGLSVPSKTFGLMSAGVPTIAVLAPHSEIGRIINEEICGVVIQPGDVQGLCNAILELSANPQKISQMGVNAREAITQKYNLQNAARQYSRLIEELN